MLQMNGIELKMRKEIRVEEVDEEKETRRNTFFYAL